MNKELAIVILTMCSAVFITACTTNQQTMQQATPTEPAQTAQTNTTDSADTMPGTTDHYVDYSESTYQQAADKKRVLFFHASWCPTCKVANQEFSAKEAEIPEGVVLLKTDYDTQTELKRKYNITYQHTFVLVDAQGNEIKKWNGGGLKELVSNTQ